MEQQLRKTSSEQQLGTTSSELLQNNFLLITLINDSDIHNFPAPFRYRNSIEAKGNLFICLFVKHIFTIVLFSHDNQLCRSNVIVKPDQKNS